MAEAKSILDHGRMAFSQTARTDYDWRTCGPDFERYARHAIEHGLASEAKKRIWWDTYEPIDSDMKRIEGRVVILTEQEYRRLRQILTVYEQYRPVLSVHKLEALANAN